MADTRGLWTLGYGAARATPSKTFVESDFRCGHRISDLLRVRVSQTMMRPAGSCCMATSSAYRNASPSSVPCWGQVWGWGFVAGLMSAGDGGLGRSGALVRGSTTGAFCSCKDNIRPLG